MALHSLGDDIYPGSRSPPRRDVSMHEDMSELAEARRRQARHDIMERGRVMEERRKRRRMTRESTETIAGSDSRGLDLGHAENDGVVGIASGSTTAVQASTGKGEIKRRPPKSDQGSIDALVDSFEAEYEKEMRESWNLQLPGPSAAARSSHTSESVLDLTPTSELIPDPDFSVPASSPRNLPEPIGRSEYFSAAGENGSASNISSPTLSHSDPEPLRFSNAESQYYYAHPDRPTRPIEPLRTLSPRPYVLSPAPAQPGGWTVPSSTPSVADSVDLIHAHDLATDGEGDDGFSDVMDDGIRTPASAWTEVGSEISE